MRNELAIMLGVQLVTKHAKYLGHPYSVGHSKAKNIRARYHSLIHFAITAWDLGPVGGKSPLENRGGWSAIILGQPLLPRPRTFQLIGSSRTLNREAHIAEFITPYHSWREGVIRSEFQDVDAKCILSIPLNDTGSPDEIVWYFEQKLASPGCSRGDAGETLCRRCGSFGAGGVQRLELCVMRLRARRHPPCVRPLNLCTIGVGCLGFTKHCHSYAHYGRMGLTPWGTIGDRCPGIRTLSFHLLGSMVSMQQAHL
ncbi:hypothetical protein Salat_2119300 [Sesamum alatum]|uniref:Uncharacterized protein n=1 Tax=Sesamum alatum TaxID=300844 RepID=A0AAE1Y1C6_9LAMI|nr:hypothetical protein Salat_2119300 [Sesamum alatum]